MPKSILITLYFAIAISPAFAESWSDEKAQCATAVAQKTGIDLTNARVKLTKTRNSVTKQVTVKVTPEGDSPSVTGACKIRRGEVMSVDLKS